MSHCRIQRLSRRRAPRFEVCLIAVSLIAPAAYAQQAPADSLATVAPKLARLVPSVPTPSFVSDERHVLTPDEHVRIDQRIRAHQDAGLGDIAVAILPSVGEYAPADIALAIYRTWRVGTIAAIGSARRNLGVLVLIVPKELAPDRKGQCFISTGPGTQGIITDATAGSICRDIIIPQLRQRAYAAAVSAGIEDISARLAADSSIARKPETAAPPSLPASPQPSESLRVWPILVAALAALLAIAAGIIRWRRRYGPHACRKCGKLMHRLAEADDDAHLAPGARREEELGSVDHDVWECECGEHRAIPYPKLFSGFSECDACHVRAVRSTRRITYAPTFVSTGLAVTTHVCENCTRSTVTEETLPQLPPPAVQATAGGSGGSGGGGSGGGGGASGGGSFGGSGSNDGGGGGASY